MFGPSVYCRDADAQRSLHVHILLLLALGRAPLKLVPPAQASQIACRALELLQSAPLPSRPREPLNYSADCALFAAAHSMLARSSSFWDLLLVGGGEWEQREWRMEAVNNSRPGSDGVEEEEQEEGVPDEAWGVLDWALTRWEKNPLLLLEQIPGGAPRTPRFDVSRPIVIIREALRDRPHDTGVSSLNRSKLAERLLALVSRPST